MLLRWWWCSRVCVGMTREAKPVKVAIKKLLTESSLEVGGGGDWECIIIILRPGRGAECG